MFFLTVSMPVVNMTNDMEVYNTRVKRLLQIAVDSR